MDFVRRTVMKDKCCRKKHNLTECATKKGTILKLCACLSTTLLMMLTLIGYRSVESSSEKRSTPRVLVPT